MEVTLTIPDNVASELQKASRKPLPRLLLELVAIKAPKLGLITTNQVKVMLSFESCWEVDTLFKLYDVSNYNITMDPKI